MKRPNYSIASLSLLVLSASGCGEDTAPSQPDPYTPPHLPTIGEARDVADVLNEHAQDVLVPFNVQELLLFELPVGTAPVRESVPVRRGGCPTVDDDTDLDGDGIPDNATFTFSGGTCAMFVDSLGTFTQSGSVHVVDAGEAPGYELTYDDYTIRLEGMKGDFSTITMNGTLVVTATTTTATLVESVVVDLEEGSGQDLSTATHTHDWTATFVANGSGQVDLSIELPSGSLTVEGSTGWRLDEQAFDFEVATYEVLDFDADCPDGPEFLTGAIDAVVVDGLGAHIDVRFVGCAMDPVVTYYRGR